MPSVVESLWSVRALRLITALAALSLGLLPEASAHALLLPPISLHHAVSSKTLGLTPFRNVVTTTVTSRSLTAFLTKGGSNFFLRNYIGAQSLSKPVVAPLFLSAGAARIFQQNKTIVENGTALGKSLVPPFTSGTVTNGALTGSLNFQNAGGGQGDGFPAYIAFGSNPLNAPNTVGPFSGPLPTGTNFLSLSGSGAAVVTKSVVGKLLVTSGLKPVVLSGAQRALSSQTSVLTAKSILLGEKVSPIFSGGTIAGGEFVGTGYFFSPGGYESFGKIVYAFGNNPLNTTGSVATNFNGPSFIDFTNGTVKTISSGELFGLAYFEPVAIRQSVLFALGSNALNNGSAGTILNLTSFKSLLFF